MQNIFSIPRKSKGVMTSMYYSIKEQQEIIKIAGGNGFTLMCNYIGEVKTNGVNPNCEDDHLAMLTGLSIKQVRDARVKLTKANWFRRVRRKGKGTIYYIGKFTKDNSYNIGVL